MEENKLLFRKDRIFLCLVILIHVICWFAMKPVFPQSDPLVYFTFAKRILSHEFVLSHSVQGHRFGVFIPEAIFIRLFGESPYIINLWTLICSLLTIILVYLFVKKNSNTNVAFISGLLLSLNLIQIIYSSVVFPDTVVSFFTLCCVYFIHKGRQEEYLWRRNSILFIISFALGFTAKESIILVLPFIAFLFWKDWKRKKFSSFCKSTSALLILFTLFLLMISKILTNDFLFFYKSFSYYQVFVPFNGFENFLKQVSYEPLRWFNSQLGYIFLLIFSAPAFISGIRKRDNYSGIESFVSLYFIILLIALWCGSVSLIHFGYVPILDRRWMMLIAPLCILSAFTIYRIAQDKITGGVFYYLIITLLFLAIVNSFEYSFRRGMLFLVFAIVLITEKILIKKFKSAEMTQIIFIILPFLLLAFYFILNNSNYVVSQPM